MVYNVDNGILPGGGMYVCVHVCIRFASVKTTITKKMLPDTPLKFRTLVKWLGFSFSAILISIDADLEISPNFEFFEKSLWYL